MQRKLVSAPYRLSLIILVALAVAICPLTGVLAADEQASSTSNETKQQHDARMAWFREARFGLFIHWGGAYSVLGGEWKGKRTDMSEWIQDRLKIPTSEYEKVPQQFNPTKFDAKQWVATAKAAGMKYVVITSKHHDGFAMFDTKLTDWGVMSTPFHRDPLKELAAACKEAGIKFCVYHSIMDWHNPDYKPRRGHNDVATGKPDMDRYVTFLKGQLKELVTNYGPLGLIWFDGEWESTWTQGRGKDLYNYCRSLQPDVIINNRVAKNRPGMKGLSEGKEIVGDYGTPEQGIPATNPGVDWETCMTMATNEHWGYCKYQKQWRPSTELIRMLIDVASKGGNFLLNVGPSPDGVIPEPNMERLRDIGRWMTVNGEAIHGTTASPFGKSPAWGRVTQKPGKLYLHVFDWPKNAKLSVPKIDGKQPTKAYLLADPAHTALAVETNADSIQIAVPEKAPDAVASVIVLEVGG